MAGSNSRQTRRAKAHMDIRPREVSWVAWESNPDQTEVDVGGTRVRHGMNLASGRLGLSDIPLTIQGIAGVAGKILPKGRLSALMVVATIPQKMDLLCWAVLRRYGSYHKALPNPPHRVRKIAYATIKRAWQRADVDRHLRYLPDGFWSQDVPSTLLQDDARSLWPVGEPRTLRIVDKVFKLTMTRPLDGLLIR
jgi:hypothetical protein